MTKIEDALAGLIDQLSSKITSVDFPDFRDACKDDDIKEEDLKDLNSAKEWMQFLCDKKLLSPEDPSFIEHVFELCRRPDLLTIVMEYRMSNLGVQDEVGLGQKLVRVRSAKKYIENTQEEDGGKLALKLSAPPKSRRKSSSAV